MDTNIQGRVVGFLVLGLIAVTCGIYHGKLKRTGGVDMGSETGSLVIKKSTHTDDHRVVPSSEEALAAYLENPSLIDAELDLEEWVKRAPSAEVERLLHRLVFLPDSYEWEDEAKLVVSWWIAKDPEKALAFVVSTRNVPKSCRISFAAGESLSMLHPELASKWLKEQKDLTPIECGAAIAGLSASDPDLAGDLLSKGSVSNEIHPSSVLDIVFDHVQEMGVQYTCAWLSGIKNEENRSRLYKKMASSKKFTLIEKAKIISRCMDEKARIDSIDSVCYSLEESAFIDFREFLSCFPMKERAFALVGLAVRFPGDSLLAHDLRVMERPDRDSAILRYLKRSPGQEERISALSALVPDPNESESYLSRINEDSFWEWMNER